MVLTWKFFSPWAVSYTHLYFYMRRQVRLHPVRAFIAHREQQGGGLADVYKRQPQERDIGSVATGMRQPYQGRHCQRVEDGT